MHTSDSTTAQVAVDYLAAFQIITPIYHGKVRKANNEPAVSHPLGVAMILTQAEIHCSRTLLVAMLHDSIEDAPTEQAGLIFETISKNIGVDVATVVLELTDDRGLAKQMRKEDQLIRLRSASYSARVVKLADRIANLDPLSIPPSWDTKQISTYAEHSKKLLEALSGTHTLLETRLHSLLNSYPWNGCVGKS